jgi:hypothetical protein
MLTLTGVIMAREKTPDREFDGDFAARLVDGLLLGLSARS